MHISKIEINQYRSFDETVILLDDGLNVIIGPNNVGKSNILNVIEFLHIDPNKSKSIHDINKNYLLRNFMQLKDLAPFIRIRYHIEHKIDFNVPDSAFSKLSKFIQYDDNGNLTELSEESYVINAIIEFRYEIDSRFMKDYKREMLTVNEHGFKNFFAIIKKYEENYRWNFYNINDPSTIEYKFISDIFEIDKIDAIRNPHEIGAKSSAYIREKLKEKKSDVNELKESFQVSISSKFSSVISDINIEIEADQDEIGVVDGRNKFVSKFEFDSDFAEFFKYNLEDMDNKYDLPIGYNGLGFNNLIYIRNLVKQKKDNDYNVLLIEEPESHLHPDMQYKLLSYINGLKERKAADNSHIKNQIIITTHSSNISAATEIENMILLNYVKAADGTPNIVCIRARDNFIFESVAKLLGVTIAKDATDDEKNEHKKLTLEIAVKLSESKKHLQKFLDVTRSDLLFASKVVFVEGLAEKLLLPMFADKVFGKKNFLVSKHIIVVEVGGILFNHFIPMFFRLGKKALCLTDSDFDYYQKDVQKNYVLADFSKFKEVVEEAKSKALFKQFCIENIKVFSQQNYGSTFEIELFLENYDNAEAFNFLMKTSCTGKLSDFSTKYKGIIKWAANLSEIGNSKTEELVKTYLDIFQPSYIAESDLGKKKLIEKLFFACVFYHYVKNKKGQFALDILLNGKEKIIVPTYIKEGLEWLLQ